jgi:nitrogen fixation NifU-like protein
VRSTYNDEVMDRYENPVKYGKMEKYDLKIEDVSTTCGDKIALFIRLNQGKIEDIRWEGEGCILSVVSTDMFCEDAVGKNIESFKELDEVKYIESFPVKISPGRINCVLLPLRAVKRGMKEK